MLQKTWQFLFQALLKTLSPHLPQLWPLLYSIPRPWSSIGCCKSISATLIPTKCQPGPPTHSSSRGASCPVAAETYGHLLHSTDHFCLHVEFCPSPWMDKDLPRSALPFYWCCLLSSSSKFDGKPCIPIQYLKTLVSVKIHPKCQAGQPDWAVLFLLLIQGLTRFPSSPQTSLSHQQQFQSPREKRPTSQVGKETNPSTRSFRFAFLSMHWLSYLRSLYNLQN